MADNGNKGSSKSLILQPANLQCKNLHDYLKTRPPELLERLYNHPAICLAVYRELPELARQYVIRILFVEQPVPQAVVASWGSQAFSKEHVYVSGVLSELCVWQEAGIPGGLLGWILSTTFKRNLKIALLGGGKPWSMSNQLETDSKARDVSFLDAYSLERWECVLHYMVGSQQQEGISADAVRILLHAGLMKRDEEDGSPVITRQGFQFLLLDTQAQVWHFILQYLDTVEQRGLDLAECLTFLFQLSFSTLGKDYSTEGMSNGLLIFLQHLREFGLVYQRKRKAGRFYPTRLALNIASSNQKTPVVTEGDAPKGYIIVETNYRVYAYTDSNLQVALLGLFTELLYRFPNLVVGILTRDSIRQALRGGITAEQIIGYLTQHAHSKMLDGETAQPLPPTVVDQIRINKVLNMLPKLSVRDDENMWIEELDDIEMGNDNCGCLGGWPKRKPPLKQDLYGWAFLPSVLLHDVFKLLSPDDRLSASSTCRTWRQALYHPSFWQDMCFNITRYNLQRHSYFSLACGQLVRNAVVKYNSLSDICVYELASMLQRMTKNLNIRSLMFEPSHCHMLLPPKNKMFLERCILGPLIQISQRLEQLSLGCCEDLCQYVPQILQSELMNPQNIKILGLASMKDDPGSYLILDCDPAIFEPFVNLQILSVDYDYVSDKFLESLSSARQLDRLIIHLHGLWDEHPGTTNEGWEQFVANHPQCQLRLTLIHAYEAVPNMHEQILHPSMPLTHLKVFFCEDLNLTVFNLLSSWYARNFRSLMWVDSQSQETTWSMIRRMGDNDANHPDPLVMAAWLCPKLEEIVFLGYKYFEEDLVGVARLCENKLRRLEVADEDVIYSHEVYRGLTESKEEISKVLGRPWAPLQNSELHPVICNPTAGDSDEYLLPIVLADLY